MESPADNRFQFFRRALSCKCPRCGRGDLFRARFSLRLQPACAVCGLALENNDSGDGPAVFLIFVLGFSLVPLALLAEWFIGLPLWLHAALWGALALILTVGALRPVKAWVLALQYIHRPWDWAKEDGA